jgi:outer membrane lipoprotein-sorting protein
MKSKSIIFSALCLFLFVNAIANQSRPAELKGENLVKEASKAIKANKSYQISFTLETENALKEGKETNKGVLITSGDKYYMEMAGNLFVSDGINTWAYFKEINEVRIDLLENNSDNPTPTSLLNDFEKKFRAKHIGQETYKGRSIEIIDLLPKSAYVFHKVRIAVDSRTKMMVYTIAYDREGGTSKFDFDKVEINPTIPKDKFKFNSASYRGIEVVDLR